MSKYESTTTSDELVAIHELPVGSPERRRLLEAFHAARMPLYRKFAKALMRTYGIPLTLEDDVIQEVALVAIDDAQNWGPEVMNWEGYLFVRAKSAVRTANQSGAWTGMTGMTTHRRRKSKLEAARERLRQQHGREPTAEEIVEDHNSDAQARYSDARRQGMIATVEDLGSHTTVELTETHGVVDIGDSFLISSAEWPWIVSETVRRAWEIDDRLGEVADAWLGGFDPPDHPLIRSVTEVSDVTGLKYETVRRAIFKLKGVAVEVLAEKGVTVDDWKSPAGTN